MAPEGIHIDGKRVRELRRARLLHQVDLADEIGIHANTLSLIERKQDYLVSFAVVKELGKFFGIDPLSLVVSEEVAS